MLIDDFGKPLRVWLIGKGTNCNWMVGIFSPYTPFNSGEARGTGVSIDGQWSMI